MNVRKCKCNSLGVERDGNGGYSCVCGGSLTVNQVVLRLVRRMEEAEKSLECVETALLAAGWSQCDRCDAVRNDAVVTDGVPVCPDCLETSSEPAGEARMAVGSPVPVVHTGHSVPSGQGTFAKERGRWQMVRALRKRI